MKYLYLLIVILILGITAGTQERIVNMDFEWRNKILVVAF